MPSHRRSVMLGRLAIFFAAIFAFALGIHALGLVINITPSMPLGLYRSWPLAQAGVQRGDIVQVCPPGPVARLGREREYLPRGSCPGGVAPMLKIVVAIGGDTVGLTNTALRIGAVTLPAPTAQRDGRNRIMARVARGTYHLRDHEIWLWSPYPGSWDSRYYGPIPESAARARASLLLAFAPWKFAGRRLEFVTPGT